MTVDPWAFGWEALAAIATAAATLVALFAAVSALIAPQLEARRQWEESTEEILYAADDAFEIFDATRELLETDWKDEDLAKLQARASCGRGALEQLVRRPSLTDGAVFTGAGAIALLEIVLAVEHKRTIGGRLAARLRDSGGAAELKANLGPSPKILIESGLETLEVTKARAERVRTYLSSRPPVFALRIRKSSARAEQTA